MNKELIRIIAVIISIFLLRIGIVNINNQIGVLGGFDVFDAIGLILYDPMNLALTLSSSLLLGYLTNRIEWIKKRLPLRILSWVAIVAICALLSTYIAARNSGIMEWGAERYSLLFASSVLCAIILVGLHLWLWFRSSRKYFSRVLAKSERTQFQYSQLKRQLNPHFLFNSLSILDYLVQEQQTERASDYIKKLANIYRYLLKQEDYKTIELSKELDFLHLYIDIMRERFLDGFTVEIDIPSRALSRKIVPCGLQVLVENAFKHNTATSATKLNIRIWCEGDNVLVSNNINPKQSAPDSNGFGLRNLRTQYSMLADKEVEVVEDGAHFTVKVPLL
ncbi:MAG: histidine kinase [Tidjanibacter sp.]|nr:histidine kinase [Tidjanibacter sp.]